MDEANLYRDERTDWTDDPGVCTRERIYRDSEKVGASAGFTRAPRVRMLNRAAATIDYFDGER